LHKEHPAPSLLLLLLLLLIDCFSLGASSSTFFAR
jgi:hypothetical protein